MKVLKRQNYKHRVGYNQRINFSQHWNSLTFIKFVALYHLIYFISEKNILKIRKNDIKHGRSPWIFVTLPRHAKNSSCSSKWHIFVIASAMLMTIQDGTHLAPIDYLFTLEPCLVCYTKNMKLFYAVTRLLDNPLGLKEAEKIKGLDEVYSGYSFTNLSDRDNFNFFQTLQEKQRETFCQYRYN